MTQVYSPEGRIHHRWTTPDRWPHRQMWLWDSAFHAIDWWHIDLALAQEAILAAFDMQAPDGLYHQLFHDYGWTASLYVDLAYTGGHTGTARQQRAQTE